MKAMALADRLKEKDSWHIYYVLLNYPGGVDQVVKSFRPHVNNGLVREGLQKLHVQFSFKYFCVVLREAWPSSLEI
ncbi:hypothetical protein ES703_114206 [subsurface metagenome]